MYELKNETEQIIAIHKNKKKLGTLLLTKGRIQWRPKYHKQGYYLSWTEFDQMFSKHCKETKGQRTDLKR